MNQNWQRLEDMEMKRLTFREIIVVASMLFGMFFGAGNLIFPASMGQLAGRNIWQASAGFLITGVGLPLLGVAALGISREDGLLGLSSRVGKGYGLVFTCILYLTIGPFFAIPRCATVSYTVGVAGVFPGAGQVFLRLSEGKTRASGIFGGKLCEESEKICTNFHFST